MRDHSLDNLKCVLIFSVVFAHLLEVCTPFKEKWPLYQLIYTFHMPAFLFLFGYHVKYSPKRIVYRWCFPYVVFQSIYLLFSRYILNNSAVFQFTTPYWLLWYMLACIFYQLLLPLFDLKEKHGQVLALLCVTALSFLVGFDDSIGYYLSLSRFFVFQPWFLLGYYCKKNRILELLNTRKKSRHTMALLSSVMIIFFVGFLNHAKIPNGLLYGSYSYSNCNGTIGMRAAIFVIAFCWIVFLVAGIKPVLQNQIIFLSRIGQYSLPVFLLHGFVVKGIPVYWPGLLSSPLRVVLLTCFVLIVLGNELVHKVIYYCSFMWLEKIKYNALEEKSDNVIL